MSMFCFQCQETAKGTGCTVKGVCGKPDDVARLQDLLVYVTKGISLYSVKAKENGIIDAKANEFITESLFVTITNVNFDRASILSQIKVGLELRDQLKQKLQDESISVADIRHDAALWQGETESELEEKAAQVGILVTENEDVRSLREMLTYGIKGVAAYAKHAYVLGYRDEEVFEFMQKGLAATLDDSLSGDELTGLVLECGEIAVKTMALLDKANTTTYGTPEITKVNIGVGQRPGILISGHDLKDMEQLLEQTKDTGVDVYTHSEMLPAHYYPAFKKYEHFVGNYGNAWWKQNEEFAKFNGPILMTTNCIIPVKESYKDRIYTTSVVKYPGVKHIDAGSDGKKDFSEIIAQAKQCDAPEELETGEIVGGFAHSTVLSVADKVIEAVKSGAIKKFVVMAGCDGRMKSRQYYTDFAQELPEDTVILTAGCAKYRYNKLDLGDIGGIPRVLDAGQCNDSYSLAVIALKLKEAFELEDVNELPISYNIAWYEQKAVAVLLALLSLGVKNIHLGPTLPGFLSPNVAKVLVDKFNISGISNVEEDVVKLTR
ncbi:hydroxylamine reductase [Desulfitispora alkaliphila]|uniref:hydroxylamine reductase n=1 Tax=Desulfitispora alkaliphila TaxID=622674 RepID=UPI003D1FC610